MATWTEGSVPNKQGQLAVFRFTDVNATSILGRYWALLAVVSVLAVCQQGPAIEGPSPP